MTDQGGAANLWLARIMGAEWQQALNDAAGLAQDLRYLTWTDRATRLDAYFWDAARTRLDRDQVTAIVNRLGAGPERRRATERYVRYCRAVATTLLVLLDEKGAIDDLRQALLYRLSLDPRQQRAGAVWPVAGTEAPPVLRQLPGHAFLLLALSPDDTAESFAARDAFLSAALGEAGQ
ncbi:MAG: hypothetical protein U1E45_00100 [Geminicoccaceae bacterium]